MIRSDDGGGLRRRVGLGAALVVGGLAALAAYAFFVEPYWIEVTRHAVEAEVTRPLRVAHLSDLHTHGFGARERRLVALLARERPDLVVVTGDVVDDGQLERARPIFAAIRAVPPPLGVWVVRGNWEPWSGVRDEAAFYASLGVRFLDNQGVALRADVWLFGLDDALAGDPDAEIALAGAPAAAFKLGLFHEPDTFESIAGLFHLGLAGHTHGGQIRLPLLGALWLPPKGKRFVAGWYLRNGSQLYVSRGIGTTILPARLLCRPEIAILDLRPR